MSTLELSGVVEVDESFFGKQRYGNQTIVVGAIERDTRRVRLRIVEDRAQDTLELFLTQCVSRSSHLTTDAHAGYADLEFYGYSHERCNQEQPENALTDGVIEGSPLLTVYNGNPRLLQSSISGVILGRTDFKRPSIVHGIGFEHGTTGNIQELEHHFGLDAKHIALTALKLLYDRK